MTSTQTDTAFVIDRRQPGLAPRETPIAAATLHAARAAATSMLPPRDDYDEHCSQYNPRRQIADLTADGGTIGPLPGGDVITVTATAARAN